MESPEGSSFICLAVDGGRWATTPAHGQPVPVSGFKGTEWKLNNVFMIQFLEASMVSFLFDSFLVKSPQGLPVSSKCHSVTEP